MHLNVSMNPNRVDIYQRQDIKDYFMSGDVNLVPPFLLFVKQLLYCSCFCTETGAGYTK